MRNLFPKECKKCGKQFATRYPKQRCCSRQCSNDLVHTGRRKTEAERKLIAERVREWREKNSDKIPHGKKHSKAVGIASRGKQRVPSSLAEVSSRTVCKVFKRLGVGCSRCGWKKAACDLHHIRGKKVPNANSHDNLTYICPNCHREAHSGLIAVDEFVTLTHFIGDRWREYYYG